MKNHWKKLIDALEYWFMKFFYGKRTKKQLIFLTVFYIYHESNIKIFLKWSINKCPKSVRLSDQKLMCTTF